MKSIFRGENFVSGIIKRMAVAIILFFAFILSTASLSNADDNRKKEELIVKIFKLRHLDRAAYVKALEYAKLFYADNKATLPVMDKSAEENFIEELARGIAHDEMSSLPELAHLYRETFATNELMAMLEFYETPEGQGILIKLPEMEKKMAVTYYSRMRGSALKHWAEAVQKIPQAEKKL
jgi:hypothetical protein